MIQTGRPSESGGENENHGTSRMEMMSAVDSVEVYTVVSYGHAQAQ